MARVKGKVKSYVSVKGYDEANEDDILEMVNDGWLHYKEDIWVHPAGNVMSIKTKNNKIYMKSASISKNNSGYYQLGVRTAGVKLVHQIIAEVFIGPRPKGKQIDHINRNRVDNRVDNLRYVTGKENSANSKKSKTHKYYGRYNQSTNIYTDPEGNKQKMTWEEYLDLVQREYGSLRASIIKSRAKSRKHI